MENSEASDEMEDHEQKPWNTYTPEVAKDNLNILRSFTKGSSQNIVSILSEFFLDSSNDSGKCLQVKIFKLLSCL